MRNHHAVAVLCTAAPVLCAIVWAATGFNAIAAAIRHLWWSVAVLGSAL